MTNTIETYVRARIDRYIKDKAEETLKAIGITTSDYIRIALIRLIDEQAIPFEVKAPNQTTINAMQELKDGKGRKFKNKEDLFKELDI